MRHIETLIIGAGHAGLAVSRRLADADRAHVVLERGGVAERWRTQSWDSLHLLTPNWMTDLPGLAYDGDDPDGFMAADDLIDHLGRYAASFDAPVQGHTTVEEVRVAGGGFRVRTDGGDWQATNVVIATGQAGRATIPHLGRHLAADITQLHSSRYRSPDSLPPGGVLVVGASSSGAQIAHELVTAGRDVVLAVGDHTRLPRRYRGRDIMWWLDRSGVLDRTIDEVSDPDRARRAPSLQLVGRPGGDDLDLGVLAEVGVDLVGRLVGADGWRARFAEDLAETMGSAAARLERVLDGVDRFIVSAGIEAPVDQVPVHLPVPPARTHLDLHAAGIRTVVWATGFTPSYPWLNVQVLDATGRICQHRGVTPVPGLYTVGLSFQHRRSSGYLAGARHDSRDVVTHLMRRRRPALAAA